VKAPIDETSKAGNEETCETSRRARTVSTGSIIALLVGAAISTALVIHHNFFSVIEAFQRTGWGFLMVLLIQLAGLALNGVAWRALFRLEQPGFTAYLLILRWIRESINYLLPVARLGGEMAVVRLLEARGRDVNIAIASLVADKTLEFLSLILFALPGIIFLIERGGNSSIQLWALRALVALFVILLAFLAAQRWGLLRLADKVLKKLSGKCAGMYGSSITGIHETVWAMYADTPRLLIAAFLHVVAWIPGALQIWVAAHFMGFKIGLFGALILESLTQVICAAAFIMPAALGAQEAAYMTLGVWLFGIPPEAGLAISLVQRLKDVLFGIPGLLVWQGFEGSRLWTRWRGRRN